MSLCIKKVALGFFFLVFFFLSKVLLNMLKHAISTFQ